MKLYRVVASLCIVALFMLPIRLVAQDVPTDAYGGYLGLQGTATGFFHIEKFGNQWWLITPEGHVFFSLGVSAIHPTSAADETGAAFIDTIRTKYAQPGVQSDTYGADWKNRWAYYTRERLHGWGFNTLSTFSHPPVTAVLHDETITAPNMGGLPPNPLPQVITNRAGRDAMGQDRPWRVKNLYAPVRTRVGGSRPFFPDVFDPNFAASQQEAARNLPQDAPWILWIFMDQTDEMRGVDSRHAHLGMVAMATHFHVTSDPSAFLGAQTYSDPKMYTKFALRDFLQQSYGSLEALNSAWGTPYTSWDSDGGWGEGTGVLDEDGRHLGNWRVADPSKDGYPAVRADLDAFAIQIMRQWYRTVYQAFKAVGSPYLLATNNLDEPKDYVYQGLKSEDGREIYADVIIAKDAHAGQWSDFLDRPFSASNLEGFLTAENDSPVGFVGTVDAFEADDATRTITITCQSCDFYWAGDPSFRPVHGIFTQFSSLPDTVVRGDSQQPQRFRSIRTNWLSPTRFEVKQTSYVNGTYTELRDALQIGDTFRRVIHFNDAGPFETQEERGLAYHQQLRQALVETSPNGVYFRVAANLWAYKDTPWFHWEVYNFGLITVRDNAYDGTEACFQQVIDAFGFQTQPESQPPYMTDPCFGDFLSPVTVANQQVYGLRPPPTGAPTPPRSGSSDAVVNGSFEDGDAAWRLGHTASFAVETSAAYDGSASLTLRDAHTATYYPLASQVIPNLLPGTYHLRAWVKTAALGTETASNSGIRLALKDNSMTRGNGHIAASQLFRLTQDWTLVDVLAQVTTSGDYTIKIEAYRKPNGTAWIDAISLEGPFNEAPIADIAADPIIGEAPLAVVYDGSFSHDPDGTISAYDWDFGDGASDSGEIVSHTFTRSGTYSTVLTVTDNAGETDAIEVVVIVAVGPQTELILNSGFEDVDALGWPLDWYLGATGAWQIEARDALDGLRSLYLSGADLESRAPIASAATVTLTPGRYIFGAWIETAALGVEPSRTRGIRLSLKDESSTQGSGNIASTPIIRGTTPMQWVSAEAEIAETGTYTLQIQTYNHPAGEAWIDGVSLMREME